MGIKISKKIVIMEKLRRITRIKHKKRVAPQKEMENQALRDQEQLLQRDIRRQMATIAFICLALFLALALAFMLYTFNQSRKKTNLLLQEQNEAIQAQKVELEKAMEQLKSAQSQLVQSEKMASLGQLTAGIAHEINNPLAVIQGHAQSSLRQLNKDTPIDKEKLIFKLIG